MYLEYPIALATWTLKQNEHFTLDPIADQIN